MWWIGLLSPLPIAVAAWRTNRVLRTSLGAALGTLPLWIYHHAWIADVSLAGVGPLIAYLSAWMAILVFLIARMRRARLLPGAAIAIPTAWVGAEYVRGEIAFEGYAWFLAGHPMIESVTVSAAASIAGVYLVSWLVVSLSGIAIARRSGTSRDRRLGLAVSLVLVGLLGLSVITPGQPPAGERVRIAALQTNVPQSNKAFPTQEQLVADFRSLIALADEAVLADADLLVTPETVLPGGLLDPEARAVIDEPFGAAMLDEQARLGVPMLVGCTTIAGVRFEADRAVWDDKFNSVFLLRNGQVDGPRYDKLQPTPFGETLPYIQAFPWLRDAVLTIGLGASGMDFGLAKGEAPRSFRIPMHNKLVSVTTPICFESSMAPTVRELVNAARESGSPTDLLCVMTNDGWFGRFDAGRAMHLLQARWRCVEHRLPMIRCANTGISAVIDREGRVIDSLQAQESGVLIGETELGGPETMYQLVGDRFGAACALLTGVGIVVSFLRGRRDRARLGDLQTSTAD